MDPLNPLLDTFAATVHGVVKHLLFPEQQVIRARTDGPLYLVDVYADGRTRFHSELTGTHNRALYTDSLLAAGSVAQGQAILAALPLSRAHSDAFSSLRMVCLAYDREGDAASCLILLGPLTIEIHMDGATPKVVPFAWKVALLEKMTYTGTPQTYRFDHPYGGEDPLPHNPAKRRNGYVQAHNPQDALLLMAVRMDNAWEADMFLTTARTVWAQETIGERHAFRDALRPHKDTGGSIAPCR